uniref:Phenolic acid decarboxylase n=1 Tax=Panagrolaimus sp. JU765 TaxID=591449 RepID=A0AC34QHU7_9BILA
MTTVINCFVFGIEEPIKHCEFKVCAGKSIYWDEIDVEFVGDYTIWPIGCPFHNRITVECSGRINPNAKLELWDLDDVSSDDLIFTFKWTHIHEGNRKAYVDAFATLSQLVHAESLQEKEVEIYFKLHNPCSGQQSKEFFIKNVVSNYTYIPA